MILRHSSSTFRFRFHFCARRRKWCRKFRQTRPRSSSRYHGCIIQKLRICVRLYFIPMYLYNIYIYIIYIVFFYVRRRQRFRHYNTQNNMVVMVTSMDLNGGFAIGPGFPAAVAGDRGITGGGYRRACACGLYTYRYTSEG